MMPSPSRPSLRCLLGRSHLEWCVGGTVVLLSLGVIASILWMMFAPHTVRDQLSEIRFQLRAEEVSRLASTGDNDLRRGRLRAAEAAYRKAISLDTALQPLVYRKLAQILEAQGRTQAALAAYAEAYQPATRHASNFPDYRQGLLHYAHLCDRAGQWSRAVTVYDWALQDVAPPPGCLPLSVHFDPSVRQSRLFQAMIHVIQGVSLDGQGRTYEALTTFRQAVHLAPDSALAQYYLGYERQRRSHTSRLQ